MCDVVALAKALADATRVRMLTLVASRGRVCCTDLARALDVSQATVSHHLRVLSAVGLVETHRDGSFVRVCPSREGLDQGLQALAGLFTPRPQSASSPVQASAPADEERAALEGGGRT